jgi:putative transposase
MGLSNIRSWHLCRPNTRLGRLTCRVDPRPLGRWLACWVLLKIAYLLMRWSFSVTVLVFRGDEARDAEILMLRHENALLRRQAGRVRYEPADRAWFTALTWFIPRSRWAGIFPVTPATLLAWHRKLAARKYDTSKRRKPGRPRHSRASRASPSAWQRKTRSGDTGASTVS